MLWHRRDLLIILVRWGSAPYCIRLFLPPLACYTGLTACVLASGEFSVINLFRRVLKFESLEDRRLLSGNTVTNLLDVVNGDVSSVNALHNDDGGDGVSLREAITAALNEPSFVVVQFDPVLFSTPQTISIDSRLPTIDAPIVIQGPGPDLLTIDAGNGTDGVLGTGDGSKIFFVSDNSSELLDVSIRGLTLMGADSSLGGGGAILSYENLAIYDAHIVGNAAARGGGIENRGVIEIVDSTISGNHAVDNNNSLSSRGGGFYQNVSTSRATIVSSTVSGNNSLGTGGGIHIFAGTADISNSTITGNSASNGGGVNVRSDTTVSISSSTITGNTASSLGGGIRTTGDTTLQSSIVAYSVSGGDVVGTIGSGSNNLIEDGSGGLPDTITGDPLLGPLADNGGPTHTHALLPGSPARSAGAQVLPEPLQDYRLDTLADFQGGQDLDPLGGTGTLDGGIYGFGTNQGLATQIPTANANDYTLELFFQFDEMDATTGYQKIVDFNGGTSEAGFYVYSDASVGNRLRYLAEDNGVSFFTGSTQLAPDTWYHLVLTRDDSAAQPLRSYLDGQLERSYPATSAGHVIGAFTADGNSSFTRQVQLLHSADSFGEHGDGAVDRIRFYDRPLTANEISQLHSAGPRGYVPTTDQRGQPRVEGSVSDIGAYEAQTTPTADFDFDIDVDGADFLAWQRGFGTVDAQRADGNSDDDTDTDASDLAAWKVSFGEPQLGIAALGSGQEIVASVQSAASREVSNDHKLIDAAIAWHLAIEVAEVDDSLVEQEGAAPNAVVADLAFASSMLISTAKPSDEFAFAASEDEPEAGETELLAEVLLEPVFS